MEGITLGLDFRHYFLNDFFFVESETASEVSGVAAQHGLSQVISHSGSEFPPEVPAMDPSPVDIASASDDVRVSGQLTLDELRDELRVMAEVSIHDDHKVTSAQFESIYIGTA